MYCGNRYKKVACVNNCKVNKTWSLRFLPCNAVSSFNALELCYPINCGYSYIIDNDYKSKWVNPRPVTTSITRSKELRSQLLLHLKKTFLRREPQAHKNSSPVAKE